MTAPEPFVHLPCPVQAMHVATIADTHRAYGWLVEHGVFAAIRIGHRHGHIVATGEGGTTLSVGIGDWLVFCPATGHFTAYEDAEFRVLHRRPVTVPEAS